MQLSTRARYAVMAMAELGSHAESGGGALSLAQIAASQQLSLYYLEQLFGGLRRAGLVASARGPGGGYRLARPAAAMTVAEIVDAVDEPIEATRCTEPGGCMVGLDGDPARCRTHALWVELGGQIRRFLASVSLADVVRGEVARSAAPR
jgi:Rrf2 family transcriptional regulator, iron-sulfur cluster assembly transcription factor